MKKTEQGSKARPGARAIDGATDVQRVTITLTEDDRSKLRKLGGSPWVRSQIRAASVPQAPSRRGTPKP